MRTVQNANQQNMSEYDVCRANDIVGNVGA